MQPEGLLRDATPAERLEVTFKVPDLKALAQQHGTRKSGTKAQLVDALFAKVRMTQAS